MSLNDHWIRVFNSHQRRIPLLDCVPVPKGWVVDGRMPPSLRDKIRARAIPLMIGGWNPVAIFRAVQYIRRIRRKYEHKVVMLLVVPHEDTESGWFARAVFPTDFVKSAEEVRLEMSQALRRGDRELTEMKECVWLAMTGRTDPE